MEDTQEEEIDVNPYTKVRILASKVIDTMKDAINMTMKHVQMFNDLENYKRIIGPITNEKNYNFDFDILLAVPNYVGDLAADMYIDEKIAQQTSIIDINLRKLQVATMTTDPDINFFNLVWEEFDRQEFNKGENFIWFQQKFKENSDEILEDLRRPQAIKCLNIVAEALMVKAQELVEKWEDEEDMRHIQKFMERMTSYEIEHITELNVDEEMIKIFVNSKIHQPRNYIKWLIRFEQNGLTNGNVKIEEAYNRIRMAEEDSEITENQIIFQERMDKIFVEEEYQEFPEIEDPIIKIKDQPVKYDVKLLNKFYYHIFDRYRKAWYRYHGSYTNTFATLKQFINRAKKRKGMEQIKFLQVAINVWDKIKQYRLAENMEYKYKYLQIMEDFYAKGMELKQYVFKTIKNLYSIEIGKHPKELQEAILTLFDTNEDPNYKLKLAERMQRHGIEGELQELILREKKEWMLEKREKERIEDDENKRYRKGMYKKDAEQIHDERMEYINNYKDKAIKLINEIKNEANRKCNYDEKTQELTFPKLSTILYQELREENKQTIQRREHLMNRFRAIKINKMLKYQQIVNEQVNQNGSENDIKSLIEFTERNKRIKKKRKRPLSQKRLDERVDIDPLMTRKVFQKEVKKVKFEIASFLNVKQNKQQQIKQNYEQQNFNNYICKKNEQTKKKQLRLDNNISKIINKHEQQIIDIGEPQYMILKPNINQVFNNNVNNDNNNNNQNVQRLQQAYERELAQGNNITYDLITRVEKLQEQMQKALVFIVNDQLWCKRFVELTSKNLTEVVQNTFNEQEKSIMNRLLGVINKNNDHINKRLNKILYEDKAKEKNYIDMRFIELPGDKENLEECNQRRRMQGHMDLTMQQYIELHANDIDRMYIICIQLLQKYKKDKDLTPLIYQLNLEQAPAIVAHEQIKRFVVSLLNMIKYLHSESRISKAIELKKTNDYIINFFKKPKDQATQVDNIDDVIQIQQQRNMKIITNNRRGKQINEITKEQADIYCFQEVKQQIVETGMHVIQDNEQQLVIMSKKFSMERIGSIDGALIARVYNGYVNIFIINVHLDNQLNRRRIQEDVLYRQITKIQEIDADIILLGDFNAQYEEINRWMDILKWVPNNEKTWQAEGRGQSSIIDHIFYNNIQQYKLEVVETESDHKMLVLNFETTKLKHKEIRVAQDFNRPKMEKKAAGKNNIKELNEMSKKIYQTKKTKRQIKSGMTQKELNAIEYRDNIIINQELVGKDNWRKQSKIIYRSGGSKLNPALRCKDGTVPVTIEQYVDCKKEVLQEATKQQWRQTNTTYVPYIQGDTAEAIAREAVAFLLQMNVRKSIGADGRSRAEVKRCYVQLAEGARWKELLAALIRIDADTARLHLLAKKDSSYRPLEIFGAEIMAWERALMKHAKIDDLLTNREDLFGFREGRNTHMAFQEVINYIKNNPNYKAITFVDFSKAYNCVDHNKLSDIINNRMNDINAYQNIEEGELQKDCLMELLRIIKNRKIRLSNEVYVESDFGLSQGAISSPMLFNVYIDEFITQLRVRCPNIERVISYADDIIIIGEYKQKDLLEICKTFNLRINNDKTICFKQRMGNFKLRKTMQYLGTEINWKGEILRVNGLINEFKKMGQNARRQFLVDPKIAVQGFQAMAGGMFNFWKERITIEMIQQQKALNEEVPIKKLKLDERLLRGYAQAIKKMMVIPRWTNLMKAYEAFYEISRTHDKEKAKIIWKCLKNEGKINGEGTEFIMDIREFASSRQDLEAKLNSFLSKGRILNNKYDEMAITFRKQKIIERALKEAEDKREEERVAKLKAEQEELKKDMTVIQQEKVTKSQLRKYHLALRKQASAQKNQGEAIKLMENLMKEFKKIETQMKEGKRKKEEREKEGRFQPMGYWQQMIEQYNQQNQQNQKQNKNQQKQQLNQPQNNSSNAQQPQDQQGLSQNSNKQPQVMEIEEDQEEHQNTSQDEESNGLE